MSTNAWTGSEVTAWVTRHGGNRSSLARLLGVRRTRLQSWINGFPVPCAVQTRMESLDKEKNYLDRS